MKNPHLVAFELLFQELMNIIDDVPKEDRHGIEFILMLEVIRKSLKDIGADRSDAAAETASAYKRWVELTGKNLDNIKQ